MQMLFYFIFSEVTCNSISVLSAKTNVGTHIFIYFSGLVVLCCDLTWQLFLLTFMKIRNITMTTKERVCNPFKSIAVRDLAKLPKWGKDPSYSLDTLLRSLLKRFVFHVVKKNLPKLQYALILTFTIPL